MNSAAYPSSPMSGCWARTSTRTSTGYPLHDLVHPRAGKRHLPRMPQDRLVGHDRVRKHRAIPPAAEPPRHKRAQTLREDPLLQAAGLHQDRKGRAPPRRHPQEQPPKLLLLAQQAALSLRLPSQAAFPGSVRLLKIQLHVGRPGDGGRGEADDPEVGKHDEQVPLRTQLQVDQRGKPPGIRISRPI